MGIDPSWVSRTGINWGSRRMWWRRIFPAVASGLLVFVASCSSPPTRVTNKQTRSAPVSTTTTTTTTTSQGTPGSTSTTRLPTTVPTSTTSTVATPHGLAITSASSAVGLVGSPFIFTVTTTCPSTSSIKAQGLPRGFTILDHKNCTGTLSGTPTGSESGATVIVITAAAPKMASVSQRFNLTVNQPARFATRSSVIARVGTLFDFPIKTVNGSPVPTLSTASALPAGLSLVDGLNGSAALQGTPDPGSGGVYAISLVATNGAGPPAVHAVTLTVLQSPTIASIPTITATVGVPVPEVAISVSGYPTPHIAVAGLPKSLTLSNRGNGTGVLIGVPVSANVGTHFLTVHARSSAGIAVQTLTLNVQP
jgi:hypothetical protein